MPVRRKIRMFHNGRVLKRFLSLGMFVAFTVLAYLLEQRGVWSGIPLLLGFGAVLAFYSAWGEGVVLNPPKALVFSLFALVLFYIVLDVVFPGALAHRASDLAMEPSIAGVLLALLLFSPVRRPRMPQG
ncbi:MAG: hypothetical protein ACP5JV_10335 [Thermus sp.]|uniref:hypothetical protein n=1 Tax=Thermus sp. TaxID=275 RepID=UPI003D0E37C0